MIIEVGESVPLVRTDNPMTDHSKNLANPSSQDASPSRHAALRRYCVGMFKGP
jgi:hypothetical protein